jgi:hypothetical protein
MELVADSYKKEITIYGKIIKIEVIQDKMSKVLTTLRMNLDF